MKPFYITTAIPYVNAKPHVGFALEIIQTDALARYQRLFGRDVRFLTGTDDNSLKNVQSAENEGISTEALVERNAKFFADMKNYLSLSNDDFIRTSTETRHRLGVEKLWLACAARGDFYKKRYEGLYCVGCEQFYTQDELVDGKCPDHDTEPEIVVEENYFFRLSKYQQQLEELIESDKYLISPKSKKNEALSFIKSGLHDFSFSREVKRSKGWGIPVPEDPDQVIWVWFDALANYINALGFADDGPLYQKYWVNCPERVHVIGKGISRFHAVYWPAILLSAGVPLPHKLLVHGYITADGQKMSKSLGNVIDPEAMCSRYGTDQMRYFLLSEISTTGDGDYSDARVIQRINSDLANDYGNLVSRIFKMIESYSQQKIPDIKENDSHWEISLKNNAKAMCELVQKNISDFKINDAIFEIMKVVKYTNSYIESNKPWSLYKEGKQDRLFTVLRNSAEALRRISILLMPIMPNNCLKVLYSLGVNENDISFNEALNTFCLSNGHVITMLPPLFPRESTGPAGIIRGLGKPIKENKVPMIDKTDNIIQQVSDDLIDIDYFKKVKLRTADVISAEKVEGADKLLRLQIKIGEETRQILAGIAQWYLPESLVGRQIVVVANLKPAKIRGLESNGMLLAAQDKDGVVILTPERRTESGSGIK